MGRTLKRVPLDFDWPAKKTWEGYLNPFYKYVSECRDCNRTGYGPDALFLHNTWYAHLAVPLFDNWVGYNIIAVPPRERLKTMGWRDDVCNAIDRARKFGFKTLTHWSDKLEEADIKALVDDGRLMDFTHTWAPEKKWQKKEPAYTPTPDEVNAVSNHGIGHDAINASTCIKARCRRYGVKDYLCPVCKGEGEIWSAPKWKKEADRWTPTEPPKGKGYQLWQTTSEGSPISPVFKTLDELCVWAAENATTFASEKATKDQWMAMLEKDFVHHKEGNNLFM